MLYLYLNFNQQQNFYEECVKKTPLRLFFEVFFKKNEKIL